MDWIPVAIALLSIAVMTPFTMDIAREIREIEPIGWRRVAWFVLIITMGLFPGLLAFLWVYSYERG
jgi:hypothetical protein